MVRATVKYAHNYPHILHSLLICFKVHSPPLVLVASSILFYVSAFLAFVFMEI